MLDINDVVGSEFDFIVVDSNQLLAVFSASGSCCIPLGLLNSLNEIPCFEDYLNDFPNITTSKKGLFEKIYNKLSDTFTYDDVAEKGFYLYEYRESTGGYKRLNRPLSPIKVDSIPQGDYKRNYIVDLSEHNISFTDIKKINLDDYIIT